MGDGHKHGIYLCLALAYTSLKLTLESSTCHYVIDQTIKDLSYGQKKIVLLEHSKQSQANQSAGFALSCLLTEPAI